MDRGKVTIRITVFEDEKEESEEDDSKEDTNEDDEEEEDPYEDWYDEDGNLIIDADHIMKDKNYLLEHVVKMW